MAAASHCLHCHLLTVVAKRLLCGALLDAWVGCAHTHAHVRHAYVLWILIVFACFFSASHMFYVCFFFNSISFCTVFFSDFITFYIFFCNSYIFLEIHMFFLVFIYVLSVIPFFCDPYVLSTIHMFLYSSYVIWCNEWLCMAEQINASPSLFSCHTPPHHKCHELCMTMGENLFIAPQ